MSPAAGPHAAASGTVDAREIDNFTRIAEEWWDPAGPFAPLHALNPARIGYIRDTICGHAGRDPLADRPLSGLDIIDIGCGGGLVCEPLARLGARMTGLDAGARNIAVAAAHARDAGLDIRYRAEAAEDLVAAGETAAFDAVLTLEIVEHVADPALFLDSAARLLKPGGVLIASTLNRTPASFLGAIIGAEYLLRWVPRGTHDWRKFLKPSELARGLRDAGLRPFQAVGLNRDLATGRWHTGGSLGINYLIAARKPA
ncbi:ubiquinone biosynthesis O-methyltransferase [Tistrella bauzanensis]|uniref:Ubiquinone biosynthesis O-methyltransferase n=1 Tax=Tistrella bauzanensis TaxID=657419 RepID=A0ABQ1ICU1_9PROT|nr:bifunctional 2-polyprenyl-6-hydroxyphenol methylase/3-demethylubiquinol 3-O-methyltransferase UbiG [Tistrella bauzanensis]GGB33565.1 ubiquinone biosynthesis O-methyltransferase [Tistrella bauzanensis]